MGKAIFFDIDTLFASSNTSCGLLRFAPFTLEALIFLHVKGYKIIITSNQPSIAINLYHKGNMHNIKIYLEKSPVERNLLVRGYYCPHHIDISASWVLGSTLDYVEAGNIMGSKTIIIDNGKETQWNINHTRIPEYMVKNIGEAAQIIGKETDRQNMQYNKPLWYS